MDNTIELLKVTCHFIYSQIFPEWFTYSQFHYSFHRMNVKGKVTPLQARMWPSGGVGV